MSIRFSVAGDGGWYCTDDDNYDGAPDTEWPSNCVGHGKTKEDALLDLAEQLHAK